MPRVSDKSWRLYVISVVAHDAEYGDPSSLDDIFNGRPEADRVRIRRAIKQLKATKELIAVGRGLYELR